MSKTAVRIAVEPLLCDAIASAEEYAKKEIEWLRKTLEQHNWNIKTAFPFPKSCYDMDYKLKKAQYNFAHCLTKTNKEIHGEYGPYGSNPDRFVIIDQERVEKHIEFAKKLASDQYEMFIRKLEHKIGEHKEAILEGNHVWSESFLYVTKEDGTKECWKTKQIMNRSKYDKWFPQWPSRKVKKKYI